MPINPWGLYEIAPRLVEDNFDLFKEYADKAYKMAFEAMNSLIDIAAQLELINTNLTIDIVPISPGTITVTPPVKPDLSANFPSDPAEPSNLIEVVFGTLPKWPDPVSISDITAGDNSYTSSVLTALQAKLLDSLQNGGNGIDPDVQTAMFERESERALLVHNDAIDRIAAEWSKRGWSMPNGALAAAFEVEQINYDNKRLDMSRDIAMKSFELAQANTHLVIQQSVAIEASLLQWTNNIAERVFQMSKAVVDAQLQKYKTQTDGANAQTQAVIQEALGKIEYNKGIVSQYTSFITAYQAKVQAEAARLDAVIKGYEGEALVFKTQADFDIAKVGLDLKVIDAQINQAIAEANLRIKDAELRMKNYEVINALKTEIAKSIGAIISQVAAGALSAINVSARVDAGANTNVTSTVYQSWSAEEGWHFPWEDDVTTA